MEEVVAHYLRTHPKRRVVSDADRKAIVRALRDYSPADLCAAITGNALDTWHIDRRKFELTYVLRDVGKIDQFRELAVAPANRNGSGPESAGAQMFANIEAGHAQRGAR